MSRFLFLSIICAFRCAAYNIGAAAVDPSGNTWITGRDDSHTVPVTADAIQPQFHAGICGEAAFGGTLYQVACGEAFAIKLDPAGKLLYATYLGGMSDDGGTAIAVDTAGNVYIAGYTYSMDFPVTPGAFQTKNAGPFVIGQSRFLATPLPGGDVFVTKLRPNGSLVYSTFLGGVESDSPVGISVDRAGSVYLAGLTGSDDFPVTPGALRTKRGDRSSFVAKLNPTGSALTYGTYFDTYISGLAIDLSGAAYLTGQDDGTLQPTPGAAQTQYGGVADAYVAKLDPAAQKLLYATYLGGTDFDTAYGIAVDSTGAAWIAGSTDSSDFPGKDNRSGVFLVKLAPDGSTISAFASFGGIGTGYPTFIGVDNRNNVYALGYISPENFTPTRNAMLGSLCSGAPGNQFIVELNPSGTVLYASFLRQSAAPVVAVESPRNVVLFTGAGMVTPLPLDLTATPAMNFGCPVNAASGSVGRGIAPAEIFSLFGNGLGPEQAQYGQPDATGHIPASLAGVQVLFNGTPVPVLYAQSGQINAVAPVGADPSAPVTVEVRYNGRSALPLDTFTWPTNLGIFTSTGNAGAILNQDGTVNSPSNPAKYGSIVSIYATGLGQLDPSITDGEIVPDHPPLFPLPLFTVKKQPGVFFGILSGGVLWAGSAPGSVAGVVQINVRLPDFPAGTKLAPVMVNTSMDSSPPVSMSVVH